MAELKPYPEYKDSGVEWIGEVPKSWNTLNLKYLFRLVYRYPTYYGIDYENNGIKEIRGEMLKGNGEIDIQTVPVRYISKKTSDQFPLTQLITGDIVMSVRGTMGKIGLVTTEIEGSNITANLLRLSPDLDKVKPRYLALLMESKKFIDELDNQSDKTTISTITVPRLLNIKVSLPSLEDQKKIYIYVSDKLKKIDSLIADKKRLIELLEEKRQAVITETVTRGLDPNVKMKDSGIEWIGEIPEHWEIARLKYLASTKKNSFVDGPFGSDLKNNEYTLQGIPVIQLNNIRDGTLRLTKMNYVTEEKSQQLHRHIAYPGNLVIAKMAAPIVRSAVVPDDFEKYVIVADCIKLELKNNVSNKFLNYIMNTTLMESQAESLSKGTTRVRVNLGIVKNLKLVLPSIEEQWSIVNYLDTITGEINTIIDNINNQITKLKQYRESLIYEAVTGKIDVRNYNAEQIKV